MWRTKIEYGGCSVRKRDRPRRSAVHCASTICQPGYVEDPEVADLALPLEVGERAERLLDVRIGLGTVDLIKVDVVGSEPAEAVLDLSRDPHPGVALLVDPGSHPTVDLRREDDVVATSLQGLPDDLLGLSGRVDVGGVDEVDPGVERRVDDPDAVVDIGVPPRAEHHRAEAVGAHADAGPTERSILHLRLLGVASSPERRRGRVGTLSSADRARGRAAVSGRTAVGGRSARLPTAPGLGIELDDAKIEDRRELDFIS